MNRSVDLENANTYFDPTFTTNLISKKVDLDKYSIINANSNYQTGANFISDHGLNRPEEFPLLNRDSINVESYFVPLNGFKSTIAGIGLKTEQWMVRRCTVQGTPINDAAYLEPALNCDKLSLEVSIKLIIDIEYNTLRSDGTPNIVTQVYTYKVRPEDINWLNQDIYPNLEKSIKDYNQYPQNISLKNIDFNGSPVAGCILTNNTYTCKAWGNIAIEGNLSTSNGYSVNINAGNEIYESDNSTIAPEIVLSIVPVLDNSQPMPKADLPYVTNFCKGTNPNSQSYQARNPSAKILTALAEEERKKQLQNTDNLSWDFNLYPNPTTKETNLTFTGNFNESLEIHVFDVTGSEVLNSSVLNENRTSIDVSKLNKGLYFVGVISNGVTKTKQLIIQ